MKKRWTSPKMVVTPVNREILGDVSQLTDAELKNKLEQAGYKFQKTYQASEDYILQKIAGSDVLIPKGLNIEKYNGPVKLKKSMVVLWEKLQKPCKLNELELALESTYGFRHKEAVQEVLEFINLLKAQNIIKIW